MIIYRILIKIAYLSREAELKLSLKNLKYCGANVKVDPRVFIWSPSGLSLGDGVEINGYSVIYASGGVSIGSNVLIGANSVISSVTHPLDIVDRSKLISKKVTIEDGCWLGAGVIVLPGVRIGRNSVVAAGSVVTSDLLPNSLYAGVPAKLKRNI